MVKNYKYRNAYKVKLETEYNPCKSVRQSFRLKMYAELTGKETVRTIG